MHAQAASCAPSEAKNLVTGLQHGQHGQDSGFACMNHMYMWSTSLTHPQLWSRACCRALLPPAVCHDQGRIVAGMRMRAARLFVVLVKEFAVCLSAQMCALMHPSPRCSRYRPATPWSGSCHSQVGGPAVNFKSWGTWTMVWPCTVSGACTHPTRIQSITCVLHSAAPPVSFPYQTESWRRCFNARSYLLTWHKRKGLPPLQGRRRRCLLGRCSGVHWMR
jgi:hypothetical protein